MWNMLSERLHLFAKTLTFAKLILHNQKLLGNSLCYSKLSTFSALGRTSSGLSDESGSHFCSHDCRPAPAEDFDAYIQNVKAQSEAFRSNSKWMNKTVRWHRDTLTNDINQHVCFQDCRLTPTWWLPTLSAAGTSPPRPAPPTTTGPRWTWSGMMRKVIWAIVAGIIIHIQLNFTRI